MQTVTGSFDVLHRHNETEQHFSSAGNSFSVQQKIAEETVSIRGGVNVLNNTGRMFNNILLQCILFEVRVFEAVFTYICNKNVSFPIEPQNLVGLFYSCLLNHLIFVNTVRVSFVYTHHIYWFCHLAIHVSYLFLVFI